jgi:hypothetical protein
MKERCFFFTSIFKASSFLFQVAVMWAVNFSLISL